MHLFIDVKLGLAFVLMITVSIVTSLRATRGEGRHAAEVENAPPFRIATEQELAEAEPLWRRRASRRRNQVSPESPNVGR